MEVVRGAQRKVFVACLVAAVVSLAVVVSNLLEAARKLEVAGAGQSHVLVARSPEVVAVVVVAADTEGLVAIVVAAEDLVDVFQKLSAVDVLLGVSAEDLAEKMSAVAPAVRVVVGIPMVDLALEAAYAVVQAANAAVLVVESIEEAYWVNPTAAIRLVVA